MNNHMCEHPATQANVETLRARGVDVLEPGTGALGSRGEWGAGRLAEPRRAARGGRGDLWPARPRPSTGVRVLVTAGGTREPIDAVRFVGNRSSGRMGFALAEEAARRGAEVTCVAANVGTSPPRRVSSTSSVETAAELADAARSRFAACDVLVMAAAVGDFRPASAAADKIKKDGAANGMELALERTEDILAGLSAAPARPTRCWSASRPSSAPATPSPTAATSWPARGWTPSWSTTSRAPTSASTPTPTR